MRTNVISLSMAGTLFMATRVRAGKEILLLRNQKPIKSMPSSHQKIKMRDALMTISCVRTDGTRKAFFQENHQNICAVTWMLAGMTFCSHHSSVCLKAEYWTWNKHFGRWKWLFVEQGLSNHEVLLYFIRNKTPKSEWSEPVLASSVFILYYAVRFQVLLRYRCFWQCKIFATRKESGLRYNRANEIVMTQVLV